MSALKFLFSFYEGEDAIQKTVALRAQRLNGLLNGDAVPEHARKMFLLMTEDNVRREHEQRRTLGILSWMLIVVGFETALMQMF